MVIWILTELALIDYSVLQTVYFALGVAELILVMIPLAYSMCARVSRTVDAKATGR